MMKKYIYVLYDPRNIFDLRYVGQTNNLKKRYREHISNKELKKDSYKNRWIKKILAEGIKPEILVIDDCKLEEADDLETFWIKNLRREGHNLTNTNWAGNHSNDGNFLSEGTRRKISDSLKGHKISNETRSLISKKHIGKIISESTREKMSKSRKGVPIPALRGRKRPMKEETKKKISNSNKGRILSKITPEGRKKLSEKSKKYKHSEVSKKKISDSNKGRKMSDAQRESIKKFMAGRKHNLGNKHSDETKKILSNKLSGNKHPQFGLKRSEETKNKIKLTRVINKINLNMQRITFYHNEYVITSYDVEKIKLELRNLNGLQVLRIEIDKECYDKLNNIGADVSEINGVYIISFFVNTNLANESNSGFKKIFKNRPSYLNIEQYNTLNQMLRLRRSKEITFIIE